ncbi:MAG: DHH family phosphoesterase [Drouetiella hepatica Uher 2000/2452]|uniref:Single-stranded-DNA-specific exonuclease RecJ n=1 Tax=Drouetiella hepatica Uher 2000/2452 TaxID=904376 RepID=A0A951QBD7_9CYAN|nr:DHH family phosphoesterase [Drouetiella hepatica Uher 2000/2452]
MTEPIQWEILPSVALPEWFVESVSQYLGSASDQTSGQYAAQLLWQRGIRDRHQLKGFVNPAEYQPTSPFAFGQEMVMAIDRLVLARRQGEKVAVWGDFDADGITATAVLWEGLGQFFPLEQLSHYIPNRLTESHGLSIAGLDALADWGCSLIITCDTGSTSTAEILYAQGLGMDVIVTDHHTLAIDRPPVAAIVNPRYLPSEHPLFHLSGVAVAFKLVEALYQTLPDVPERPLEHLLDLVAIGLIADLVQLKGDCRYLAQLGIAQLQKNRGDAAPRPGVARLLELCRKSGDRPTDISFGLGPRINAISRIQGDARFCVELLTSRDKSRCYHLATDTELANARRKILQRDLLRQVKARLAHLDLSTTHAIVLADSQWAIGVLGLVAGQVAQEYGRPTILLSFEERLSVEESEDEGREDEESEGKVHLARGSARSTHQIDLYQLVQQQAHLLHSFGGHPFAAGLSLPVKNIPLFAEALNRQLRQQAAIASTTLQADLTVTVADLIQEEGKALFAELSLLEPCGMGNPMPRLLIHNCWFTRLWHRKIKAALGDPDGYIKTEFEIWDESSDRGFPGIWWGHYKDEIPSGRCDAIVELDFNSYQDAKRQMHYEVRLVAVRSQQTMQPKPSGDWLLDWRQTEARSSEADILRLTQCPSSWAELHGWMNRARQSQRKLAIAYDPPSEKSPTEVWQNLVGVAKYLSRTGQTTSQAQLCEKLGVGDRTLRIGLQGLSRLGFVVAEDENLSMKRQDAWQELAQPLESAANSKVEQEVQFAIALQEENFNRRYFYEASLETLRTGAEIYG